MNNEIKQAISLFERMKEGNINSISAMCALLIVFQRRGVEFENVQNLLRTDKDATQAILGGLRKKGYIKSERPQLGTVRKCRYYMTKLGNDLIGTIERFDTISPQRASLVMFLSIRALGVTRPSQLLILLKVASEPGISIQALVNGTKLNKCFLYASLLKFRNMGIIHADKVGIGKVKSFVYFPKESLNNILKPRTAA